MNTYTRRAVICLALLPMAMFIVGLMTYVLTGTDLFPGDDHGRWVALFLLAGAGGVTAGTVATASPY